MFFISMLFNHLQIVKHSLKLTLNKITRTFKKTITLVNKIVSELKHACTNASTCQNNLQYGLKMTNTFPTSMLSLIIDLKKIT